MRLQREASWYGRLSEETQSTLLAPFPQLEKLSKERLRSASESPEAETPHQRR